MCPFNLSLPTWAILIIQPFSLPVEVHLQATGDAPIMKQKKYKVDGEKRIDWIIAFIRKFLKLEPSDSLVSILHNKRHFHTQNYFSLENKPMN